MDRRADSTLASQRVWAAGLVAVVTGLVLHAVCLATPHEDLARGYAALTRSDVVAAMSWFRKAAEAGYAPAQVELGELLDGAGSDQEAARWFRLAAEQGYAPGAHALARMYATGEGVSRDYGQAVRWFRRAAQAGHAPAIRVLVGAYERGALGLAVDPGQARRWLQRGAQEGDPWAIRRLSQGTMPALPAGDVPP